jgi:hypothetical protein
LSRTEKEEPESTVLNLPETSRKQDREVIEEFQTEIEELAENEATIVSPGQFVLS